MKPLEKRVATVTGAGTGIGRAIASALAGAGSLVAVTDVNLDWAKSAADEIAAAGGESIALKLDVTHRREAQDAVHSVVDAWGRLDVWVNNAGVSTMRPFLELTEQDWDFNMDVNAGGTFICSQAAARQMIRQSPDERCGLRGKLINMASMAGKRGNAPFLAHYVASKFAVVGLTQAMAGELAPHGILVNAVCPGYVRTSMQRREIQWEAELRGIPEADVERLYVADTPLGRIETPEDVADIVVFLASDGANFVTGESIQVNGGAWMG
jgi:NAD(P)-dependent dehydrogenase (short-subunit alcohol dehydrogenase family)